MKPKFFQFDCREQKRTDFRQTRAVLKYEPDIIFFEYPGENGNPESIFNKYNCENKPFKEVEKIKANLKKTSKQFKYALSDIKTWESIEYLWRNGYNVLLYNVDASKELRQEFFEVWRFMYPCALKNWLWWVKIYIRERIMADHIRNILKKYKRKPNPTVLVFLQSFHWLHVKFLLTNPSKKEIWKYYFGKFNEVAPQNIESKIKKQNKLFHKYWLKYSDF